MAGQHENLVTGAGQAIDERSADETRSSGDGDLHRLSQIEQRMQERENRGRAFAASPRRGVGNQHSQARARSLMDQAARRSPVGRATPRSSPTRAPVLASRSASAFPAISSAGQARAPPQLTFPGGTELGDLCVMEFLADGSASGVMIKDGWNPDWH